MKVFKIKIDDKESFASEYDLDQYNKLDEVKFIGYMDTVKFNGFSTEEIKSFIDKIKPTKKKLYEVRSVSSANIGKPLATIEADDLTSAWDIARKQFPYLKDGYLSVRIKI